MTRLVPYFTLHYIAKSVSYGRRPKMSERGEERTQKREARRTEVSSPRSLSQKIAGVLLSIAGATILMSIITGEALYPAPYNTSENAISDLGGTMPSEGGIVLQPSAAIFDATMLITGPIIIIGAYFVHRAFKRWGLRSPSPFWASVFWAWGSFRVTSQ
jgi:hypothetical protein